MMDLQELFWESLGTLTLNRTRTGLAILGIVIGIGSVIALISLGQSSQVAIQSQIQSLGANLLTVNPGAIRQGGVTGAAGGRTTLTNADADAMKNSPGITTVKYISPEYSGRTQITTGSTNTNTEVVGVTSVYAVVHKVNMDSGVFISDNDVNSMAKVAVIGPGVSADLFGEGVNPVGNSFRIKGQPFTVIGLTVSKGGAGFQNPDNMIFIPLSTAQKQIFGVTYLSSIAVEASGSDVMTAAQDEVGYFLLARHKISSPADADFSIFSQADILTAVTSTTGTFTTLLSGVAAISLLVGGIGIMNIMLVTVTERTREIGLRKALGAKKKTIIAQFLIESIILTFAGGVIGVVLGIVASYAISYFTGSVFVIVPSSVVLAFVVSAGIGILFGWYPARRASNLQPIEALRYE